MKPPPFNIYYPLNKKIVIYKTRNITYVLDACWVPTNDETGREVDAYGVLIKRSVFTPTTGPSRYIINKHTILNQFPYFSGINYITLNLSCSAFVWNNGSPCTPIVVFSILIFFSDSCIIHSILIHIKYKTNAYVSLTRSWAPNTIKWMNYFKNVSKPLFLTPYFHVTF